LSDTFAYQLEQRPELVENGRVTPDHDGQRCGFDAHFTAGLRPDWLISLSVTQWFKGSIA
jgi:hypothetical protein